MSYPIILCDSQPLFLAGMASIFARQDDFRIVAQCTTKYQLISAMQRARGCVVLTSISDPEIARVLGHRLLLIGRPGSRAEELSMAYGLVYRDAEAEEVVTRAKAVAAGERSYAELRISGSPVADEVGRRVLQRLTLKETQVVARVANGARNRQIAIEIGTTEQVVKNYLRSVYDKTGVSGRLELALYVLHHPALAEAVRNLGFPLPGVPEVAA